MGDPDAQGDLGPRHMENGGALQQTSDLVVAFLVILTVSGLSAWCDVVGWRALFSPGGRQPSMRRSAVIHVASEAILKTIPGGLPLADGVRVAMLRKGSPLSGTQSLATVVSRRVYLGVAQGAFVIVGSVIGVTVLGDLSQSLLGWGGLAWLLPAVAGTGVLLIVGLMAVVGSGRTFQHLGVLLRRIPFAGDHPKMEGFALHLGAIDRHIAGARNPGSRRVLLPLAFFAAVWALDACETFLVLRLLNFHPDLGQAMTLEILVSGMRLAAFFVPSGIGVQDAGYVGLLMAMGLAASAAGAAPFVFLKRAKDLLWIVLGYALLLAYGAWTFRRPPTVTDYAR